MPKTTLQKIIFSILMSFIMVYGMEVYNGAIKNKGMTNSLFLIPFGELLMLMAIVIVSETFIGGPLARKLALRLVDPQKDRPIIVILVIQTMTVCMMCPIMSFIAAIIFKGGFNTQILAKWVQTVAINFPMAFCWQIIIAGPSVRFVVRIISKLQKSQAKTHSYY